MDVKEYNFHILGCYGGIQLYSYQLAFGFSIRWGEFKAIRIYFGPIKFWLSLISRSSNRKVIENES